MSKLVEEGWFFELELNRDRVLTIDYGDLRDIERMLRDGINLRGCIESLFIVCVIEPTWVIDVKISSEPKERQRKFVDLVIQGFKEFIRFKKNEIA